MKDYLSQVKQYQSKTKRWDSIIFWSVAIVGTILFLLAMGIAGKADII